MWPAIRACDDGRVTRVYLECGTKWTFACALDWPGWCRCDRSDEAAIETLLAYAPRYAAVVGEDLDTRDVTVVGRLRGNATTDFGAPAVPSEWDLASLSTAELDRQVGVLQSAWRYFDAVVNAAPQELRKGPRGGGRDRDAVKRHVIEAERAYAPKAGTHVPPRTPWVEQRARIADGLRSEPSDTSWPLPYVLRRMTWHVLDHAWEIEDRRPSA